MLTLAAIFPGHPIAQAIGVIFVLLLLLLCVCPFFVLLSWVLDGPEIFHKEENRPLLRRLRIVYSGTAGVFALFGALLLFGIGQ